MFGLNMINCHQYEFLIKIEISIYLCVYVCMCVTDKLTELCDQSTLISS